MAPGSAGSIFDISKYRDTCESSIFLVSNAHCSIPSISSISSISSIPSIPSISSPFDDVDAKALHRCR